MGTHSIYLGDVIDGERLELDFNAEEIRFVLLVGMTGSGKSVFHSHLYREFMCAYAPEELGFIFLDMTRVDFADWDPAYLAQPIVHDIEEAFQVLENAGTPDTDRKLLIHIEECDMVYRDRARMEAALDRLKTKENVMVVYSTSRSDPTYLAEWMRRYIDMKVVFAVSSMADSRFLLGNDAATSFTLPGERIVAYQDKQVRCMPLSLFTLLPFEIDLVLSLAEYEKLKRGFDKTHISKNDYKWHIFFKDNWIYFNRSLTDMCNYRVRFEPVGSDYRAIEAMTIFDIPDGTSREQYNKYHSEMIKTLIAAIDEWEAN